MILLLFIMGFGNGAIVGIFGGISIKLFGVMHDKCIERWANCWNGWWYNNDIMIRVK